MISTKKSKALKINVLFLTIPQPEETKANYYKGISQDFLSLTSRTIILLCFMYEKSISLLMKPS